MASTQRVRLVDVAHHAGVSIATASRSLAGASGVSDELATRVRDVAAELGYRVNAHARALAGGDRSALGLIVHEIGDPYFTEIAGGVLDGAGERDLAVRIGHTGRDPQAEVRQIRLLAANGVDQIIIAGSGSADRASFQPLADEVERFRAAGGRVAVIGRHLFSADAVLPDNRRGGRTIGDHIVRLGHRRIAVAAGERRLTTIVDRLRGLHEAFAEAGMNPTEVPVIEAAFNVEGGRRAAARILEEHPTTTAIVALNDAMAIGVLSELRRRRIAVPTELSVTGFDDVEVAADLAPALTTVHLPMASFGRLAIELLNAPPSPGRPRHRQTAHQLVVRDSTAAPTV